MKKETFKIIVFYDNWCPMCTEIKKKIEKYDWLHLVEMVGIRNLETILIKTDIPISKLEKSMHAIILRDNSIVSGIHAFTSISWRIPILIPFWPILKFSSIIGLGQKMYEYVAEKRSIVPVGKCDTSCKINNQ